MKLLIKDTKSILEKSLSFSQRGILVSIMLLRESDSKMTLAKLKALTSLNKIKEDLIYLHENKYIEWSGYKNALKTNLENSFDKEVEDIVNFMNGLYKRGFKKDTYKNLIISRLKENSITDIKLVISNRYLQWKDDPVMHKSLIPTTVFRKVRFDTYLAEALANGVGKGVVDADDLGIEHKSVITADMVDLFKDSMQYTIRTFQVAEDGSKRGLGVKTIRKGSDIKKMVKLEERKVARGEKKEYIYTYIKD